MQTLHFHTNRIFLLVGTIFFFMFMIITYQNLPQFLASNGDDNFSPKKGPHFKNNRFGEQLSFPKQAPPHLDESIINYKDLHINRDVDEEIIQRLEMHLKGVDFKKLIAQECIKNMTLDEHFMKTQNKQIPKADSWEIFYSKIGSCGLYEDSQYIDNLLHDLNTLQIKNVQIMDGGTQVKLLLTFSNDKQAVYKPMRFGRDYETDENHFYFGDFERHNAEIATFHLDKILGFRRAVPTVGRVLDLAKEIIPKADKKLKRTFFVSPANNTCFVSKCDYYCDTTHAICGTKDLKEGSVQVFLPDDTSVPRKHNKSPYRRTYSKKNQLATWQTDMRFCSYKVRNKKIFAHGRKLLDLVDLHIMDYLIGNQDRHHYESFNIFNDIPSYAIHLDNGRAFGKTNFDDDDILMPLRQCCVVKASTLATLMKFYSGVKSLTETLHESLAKDPVRPILAYKHYPAMERRLNKLMKYLLHCFDKNPVNSGNVVVGEYHNDRIPRPKEGEVVEDDDENKDD